MASSAPRTGNPAPTRGRPHGVLGKKYACEVLLDLDGARPGPLHERLTRALRTAIREGRFKAGSALPPSRSLALDLGCSRWVVTQAYDQLVAEGYLTARTGSATRVRARPPEPTATEELPSASGAGGHARGNGRGRAGEPRFDLAPGLPDLRAFPRRSWLAALRDRLATMPYDFLGYPDPQGSPPLREILAGYLRRVRGADVDPRDLTICTGVTDGVTRIGKALQAYGIDTIAVEDPGWTRLRDAIRASGLGVVGVPVDEHGLVVEELERTGVRAVVATPAHQFPTGVALSPERRRALLGWASRVDGFVLEDDYDAEFRYDRRPVGTLQGAEAYRVVLVGSLSKTLSPALGIGWALTPGRLTATLEADRATGRGPSALEQLAFAAFLERGEYDRFLRTARLRYRRRRDALVSALQARVPGVRLDGIAAGLHLVVRLPGAPPTAPLVRAAEHQGLRLADLDTYRLEPDPTDPALVLGYGNLPDRAVDPAVTVLSGLLR